ncbi:MAG: VOC family protein [Proteobacteria bacterium]|nr:MAG: VOC family protein [Pseudomonadota bacterium]
MTNSIPDGYHTVTPYLVVKGVADLIEFIKEVFDGEDMWIESRSDGSIQHARVRVGDSPIMMGEPVGDMTPTPATLYVYVDDPDAAYERALKAGAISVREPADQLYGDRNASVQDASGNRWWMAVHKEDVSPEKLARRVT